MSKSCETLEARQDLGFLYLVLFISIVVVVCPSNETLRPCETL